MPVIHWTPLKCLQVATCHVLSVLHSKCPLLFKYMGVLLVRRFVLLLLLFCMCVYLVLGMQICFLIFGNKKKSSGHFHMQLDKDITYWNIISNE